MNRPSQKPEFKMPIAVKKPVPKPVGPSRRTMPQRTANAGKMSVTNQRRMTLLGGNKPMAGKSSVRNSSSDSNSLKFEKPEDLF